MGWSKLFKCELKAIFSNFSLLFTVFGGVVFYSFLYPLPYINELPRDQRVAVVNLDHSQMSRELIRMVDATPQVAITEHLGSIGAAKVALEDRQVDGILVIPEHFYRDVMMGTSPTLAYAGNAALFLVYGTVVEGLNGAGNALGAKAKIERMMLTGDGAVEASQHVTAMKLNMRPVFNVTMGYINYVVPAVFVLILHQTLLIGVGMMGATENEARTAGKTGYWAQYPIWMVMAVRALLFTLIYLPLVMYYFGFSYVYYGVNRLTSIHDLIMMTIPFLLAVIMLGMVLGQLLPRCELVTLVVLLSSLPLVFSAGFIWPPSAIPAAINYVAQLAPSTAAINGFLGLNQLGASFAQEIDRWGQLWLQFVGFAAISYWLMRRARK
ncbi:ABC-2 family transporter protein [Photobacterium malacitanum]|uniref:ABC-2 family transporter protein n=1 Tax=Photobacterium malacitanum TaxID=2204294 RepID=A0A1Y6MDQ7_9GAMM|nr:ABC transporter permease [Photobacterium malacitanum]SMY34686.1 ABC-2 family transporter protein [Photobacterium malacitanum]